MTNRKSCSALNAAGDPCRSTSVRESGFCAVHDPASTVAHRFMAGESHTVGPGAPSKFDLWRDQVLEEFDVWIAPYRLALEANATATFQGETFLSPDIADAGARIAAAEKVFDRLFGKPTQFEKIEHSGSISLAGLAELTGDEA